MTFHFSLVACAVLVCGTQMPADAEALDTSPPGELIRPYQIEARIDLLAGGGIVGSGSSYYGGFAHSILPVGSNWDVFVGAGAYGSYTSGEVEDRLGLDGKVAFSRVSLGPEFRVGLLKGRKKPSFHTHLSFTPIYLQGQSLSEEFAERGSHWGQRYSLGISFPGSWRFWAESIDDDKSYALLAAWLLPNHLTIFHERVPDARVTGEILHAGRTGVSLGYTF